MEAEAELATDALKLVAFASSARVVVTLDEMSAKDRDQLSASGANVDEEASLACGADLRANFDIKALKELYRSFVLEAFMSGGKSADAQGNAERLFAAVPALGLALGLDPFERRAIDAELGASLYKTYLSRVFGAGQTLGAGEEAYLEMVADTLRLDKTKCGELVREQKGNRVANMIEQIFGAPQVLADDVLGMREAAALLEVDLVEDLQVSANRRERMFLSELEELVTEGDLAGDGDLSAMEEVCEGLGIERTKALELLAERAGKKACSGVLQAAATLRQETDSERGEKAVRELDGLLRWAALMEEGAVRELDLKMVSGAERGELLLLYQSARLNKKGRPAEEEQAAGALAELLKAVLKLD